MAFSQFSAAIRIFFSYATSAATDKNLFERLTAHLSVLRRQGLIDEWYDSAISPKADLGGLVETYIDRANIIVLLLSADFFDSERCYEIEMKRALELSYAGMARIVPVLLRPAEWKGSPLDQYNPLPPDGKPVSLWSNTDAALTVVARGIRKVVEEFASFLGVGSRSDLSKFPLFNVPHRPNQFFTDREDILTVLHNYFTSNQAIHQTRIQALNGLGGIGKTQLAVEYARLYKHEYQAVLWLKASSRNLLNAEAAALADLLSLSEKDQANEQKLFIAIRRWLQNHDQWLLILDNLEDFDLIDLFIPSQCSGHVLLTTQSQVTGPLAHSVSVKQMMIDDSTLFLLRRAKLIDEKGSREEASEADYNHATAIARELDGFPLALDQAGAYIEETGRSLAEYLELYRQHRARLLRQRGRFASGHPDSVTVTIGLAFEKVAQECPEALELLRLFAFLHPDTIPDEMIAQGSVQLDEPLRTLASDPFELDRAVAVLRNFSLVRRRTDATTLSVHRIVQAILVDALPKEQQIRWARLVVRLVNSVFPDVDFNNWAICERYLPQAQRVAEIIAEFHLIQDEASYILLRLGRYCYHRARYREAQIYLRDALHHCEQKTGERHLEMAQALNSLGLLYKAQGNYTQAEEVYVRALTIREQALGTRHLLVAESLNNLGFLYTEQARYQEAKGLYERAMLIYQEGQEGEHPESGPLLNNLAILYRRQGNYVQAEAFYRRVLILYERILPAHHPNVAGSLNNLAILYMEQARYQEAKVLYERALALREQVLGSEHPQVAQSLNYLARSYKALGDYQRAELLYRRALSLLERQLGPEHLMLAHSLNNLGCLLSQQGEYNRAEQLYERALQIYEHVLGSDHPITASAMNNVGRLYYLLGRNEHAERLLRRALAIRLQIFGSQHTAYAQSLNNLAELFIVQRDYEQAEALLQQALAIRQRVFGLEHPFVARVLENYAVLLKQMGRVEEALALQKSARSIKDKFAPPQESEDNV
jgi:tetratricopeptide (TPR) repeat protein